MSQSVITNAFEQLKAQQAANGSVLVLDEFVFANIPGLDTSLPISRDESWPEDGQIVHRQAVGKTGMVNANAVAYSAVLGADVGDFEFNWIGLISSSSDTVCMIVHAPLQKKIKTAAGQQGNVLTRSFLMEYSGASEQTAIVTPVDTWQIDFTARLNAVDERIRIENTDTYGAASFLAKGFKVTQSESGYSIARGVGYVEGIRARLLADQEVSITQKPVKVWVDVSWRGTLTSIWSDATKIVVAESLANYVTDDEQHYVYAVAEILADGSVIDLRPVSVSAALSDISPAKDTLIFFNDQEAAELTPVTEFGRDIIAQGSRDEVLDRLGLKDGEGQGVADSSVSVKQPVAGAVERTQHDKNADVLSAMDFAGMKGDGVSDDTLAFAALEAVCSGRVIELAGRVYKVSAPPVANTYVNGTFLSNSLDSGLPVNLPMFGWGALISSSKDTGGYGIRYQNPLTLDYQMSGRTTQNLYALLASQNSRALGPARAVVIGSIYSYASGNVSGNYSARQCRATVPQSFNIGSEDCRVDGGFRGSNISSITSHVTGETGVNIGCRRGWATGFHALNLASVDAYAGGGHGAVLKVTVKADGTIGAISIVSPGTAYSSRAVIAIYDRQAEPTVTATASFTINASGELTSVTLTNAGAGYTTDTSPDYEIVQACVRDAGNYSANVATANNCVTYGEISFNLGSNNCAAKADRSGNIASNGSRTEGMYAVNMGTETSAALGNKAMVLASGASEASADLAMVLSGTSSKSTAVGAVTIGRRTQNDEPRSVAFGDASTGDASPANRKFHLKSNGSLALAGALSQNVTFTDLAKMFENVEPVAIPVGSLVAWEGRKVRPAVKGDVEFSAHSRTYAILFGDSQFTWADRYQRDEFGEILTGEVWDSEVQWDSSLNDGEGGWVGGYVTAELENPDFDASQVQVARSKRRDEWTPVALVGEVHIRVDASVIVDGYVCPSDVPGLATASDEMTRIRCMEMRAAYDAEKGYGIALCLVR